MSDRVRLREDRLEWRSVEDEVVAVDLGSADYLAVNLTGAVLWPSLASGCTREELTDELVRRFEVTRETARHDVDAFVDALDARGLIER